MSFALRGLALSLSFLMVGPLFAEDPAKESSPPTDEEVKAALRELTYFFSSVPAAPVQPEWWPLQADEAKQVDELLATWDERRSKATAFQCKFRKWEFDPAFGPRDATSPAFYSEGEFRTDAADVWMWRETRAAEPVTNGT